ncbi:MAG TPA: type II secretion system protein [Fimbriiglobus sp.]|jgi:general secretion pathway protein G
MLAIRRFPDSARLTRRSRDAFTLVEILVVVAILVILASVGTIGLLKYLDWAKENNARLSCQNIQKAVKSYRVATDLDWPVGNLQVLIGGDGERPWIEGGERALYDPWGNMYQLQIAQGVNGDEIPVVYTQTPQGKRIAWPKEYENSN